MSALDQAISKAYAKDRSTAVSPIAAGLSPPSEAARVASAHPMDQLYHDGALYRVEGRAQAPRVPTPHLPGLPPTSPRRTVRRSLQRLLTASTAAAELENPPEPPRIARKVIIRHISHGAAPAPLGMLRETEAIPSSAESSPSAGNHSLNAELPPETIADEPVVAPVEIAMPSQTAPLNVAATANESIQAYGPWDHHVGAGLVLPHAMFAEGDVCPPLVTVQLESLAIAEELALAHSSVEPTGVETQPALAPFPSKSLYDPEEPQRNVRLDAPHSHGRHAPHARFRAGLKTAAPPVEEEDRSVADRSETAPSPSTELDPVQNQEARAENEGWPPQAAELTFAEPSIEPLASDLVPVEEPASQPSAQEDKESTAKPKPALPLWEVDRFHWPRACEKLMADTQGYFSRAGNKLLAAVEDGLRVLAVTGSRRGEGRTTLALCLARAAAKGGIQTAVMDADFARPQLASKIALDIAFGWQDAALGRIPLSEAAVKSLADEITVLPLESSAATRSLSLADPRVTATIRAAAATFELLILDLGPMSPGAKIEFPPGEICPLDAAIVVRDERFATAAEGEAVGRMLQDAGLEAVGIAENFVIEEELPANSLI